MDILKEIRRALIAAVMFTVLTFPVMVIKINSITNTIDWQWQRLILIGVGGFLGTLAWNLLRRRQEMAGSAASEDQEAKPPLTDRLLARVGLSRDALRSRNVVLPSSIVLAIVVIGFPFVMSLFQTNIMISALIYVILALGLNIVIGLGGMLHIGYAAFYLVGAYTYGLLNYHFGVSFWIALPAGAIMSTIFGILLAIPVLRLRGDYLAIVTLAFGEIMRIIMVNWGAFSQGPGGIKGIDRPGLFGIDFSYSQAITLTYFVAVGLVVVTVLVVYRLENSRIGRQLVAHGEDDIAARAMGVDTTRAKMTAFALGAFFAGLAGVLFAAKTTLINPASFRVWESVLVLCIIVLGGMGSIPGVIVGAFILILLPEYLRPLSDYRLLAFGAILVVMMVFRPGGIIPKRRKLYQLKLEDEQ